MQSDNDNSLAYVARIHTKANKIKVYVCDVVGTLISLSIHIDLVLQRPTNIAGKYLHLAEIIINITYYTVPYHRIR